MVLTLHAKLSMLEAARNFDFKGCLERTHCSVSWPGKNGIFPKTLRPNEYVYSEVQLEIVTTKKMFNALFIHSFFHIFGTTKAHKLEGT